jgi:osmotically-inducible protein OsmY
MNNYSPQMIEKMDTKLLPLATASILGQAPGLLKILCSLSLIYLAGCVATAVTVAAVTTVDVAHDRRTIGEYIDDQSIEFTIRTFVVRNDELRKNAHISATSMNGILLLTGEAPTTELKNKVTGFAKDVEGVRQLVDELRIAGETGYISRTNDVWLTTKVKSVLFAKTKLDANRVKVVSEAGSVYLMGLVSREEAENATQITRQVGGVTQVVQVFEYKD